MKIYFFCYDWSINKDTGAVVEDAIHASAFEPTGDNMVLLGTKEIAFTLPSRESIAISALAGLDDFEARSRDQHHKNLADIKDKRATYMLLSHTPQETEEIDDDIPF